MKKEDEKDEMRDEYDFTGARRGVHHKRYDEGHNVRQLRPELAEQFRDDQAVNEALEEYLKLKRESA